ncbi:hypothetical protein QJS10_CPB14g00680 [Acorus calamus]|uniref:Uncharacterized protein n=1 Tax=Acorus calamus TaxID=4465 RepID=A0AAV9DD74_ACOCL|nr:hypothetical protein QJS10_CPB14g00680 [Acorus calamus]
MNSESDESVEGKVVRCIELQDIGEYIVRRSSDMMAEVAGPDFTTVVRLDERTCTCRQRICKKSEAQTSGTRGTSSRSTTFIHTEESTQGSNMIGKATNNVTGVHEGDVGGDGPDGGQGTIGAQTVWNALNIDTTLHDFQSHANVGSLSSQSALREPSQLRHNDTIIRGSLYH